MINPDTIPYWFAVPAGAVLWAVWMWVVIRQRRVTIHTNRTQEES